MIKVIFLLFLSTFTLFASDINPIKVKILEKIISNISINEDIKIWSDDKNILLSLKENNKLKTVNSCDEASILIINEKSSLTNSCYSKYIFVQNYNLLREIPQSFGALFWKKGRPNIVIVEPRISNQSISVTDGLKPYLEEKVW